MSDLPERNYAEYLPKPRKWLKSKVVYKGHGTATFQNPRGTVEGQTTVLIDESGITHIELTAENLTLETGNQDVFTRKKLTDFLVNAQTPESIFVSSRQGRNPCNLLLVDARNGQFRAKMPDSYALELNSNGMLLKFRVHTSEFLARRTNNAEKYFVLPLVNFVIDDIQFDHWGLTIHPLRLFEFVDIPDDLDELQTSWLKHQMMSIRFISFELNGSNAFIQPLPDFEKRRTRLLTYKKDYLVTAVLVGELGQIDIEHSHIPNVLLTLLSLATGTRVGIPWIEIRSSDGKLMRRIHQCLNLSSFKTGLGILPSTVSAKDGGIGKFLSQAQTSPSFEQQYIRAVSSQILLSGYHEMEGNIEDCMSHVFRGLENLCSLQKKHRKPSQLEDNLTPELALEIREILGKSIEALQGVKGTAKTSNAQKSVIGAIQGSVEKLLAPEPGLKTLFLELLEINRLQDQDVLEGYYKTRPYGHKDSWINTVIKTYRNAIFHGNWFDWTNPPHWNEVGAIMYHIRDILIRLILIDLKYDGHYQPQLPDVVLSSQSAFWVTKHIEAHSLGYHPINR